MTWKGTQEQRPKGKQMGFGLGSWELALEHLALGQMEGGKGNEWHKVMGEYGLDGAL